MGKDIRKYSHGKLVQIGEIHRFEHWYIDNQVYFITARCRDRFPAFASDRARAVFWDRFEHYAKEAGFVPWVTSLMGNHYHTLGYARDGQAIGRMVQRIHGSVAKLVNDTLVERRRPFWAEAGHQDYFDGCIRDETQCRRAFRYTLTQSVRHGMCGDWREYQDTRVRVELDAGVKRALELGAFLEGVPYKRYFRRGKGGTSGT
ncbi:MAG: transposase [Planctomycetota bacterium]|nr:transposase [Planctomycetota bacterium]